MANCSYGHLNSAGAAFCTTCGLAIVSTPVVEVPPIASVPPPGGGTAPPGYPLQPAYVPPPEKSRGWILPVALLAGIAVVVGGYLVFQAAKPKTTTLTVVFDLYNGSDSCSVDLGYNDIPGASVVVEGDGIIVGTSALDYFGSDMGYYCEFTADVIGVPTDKNGYSLMVGGANRGVLTSTRSELEASGWSWGVTLGN